MKKKKRKKMADFLQAHKKTSVNEGGYANVTGDRGGETYAGISRVNWPNWKGWKIVDKQKPLKHNQKIKDPELENQVLDFYKKNFWDVLKADQIENQDIAFRLYDFGVTSGQSRSVKQIQKVLGLKQTGTITDDLIEAINNPAKYLI